MLASRIFTGARHGSRAFSTSRTQLDLAKVTLIGRLGADPVLRETSSGKPYYSYNIATSGNASRDAAGQLVPGPTSWHQVFAFNERNHEAISKIGKGSTVYVEADLEMRPQHGADGQRQADRAILRHGMIRVISRVRPEKEDAGAIETEES